MQGTTQEPIEKQTQFIRELNQRKYCYCRGIRRNKPFSIIQKQSQFKANFSGFPISREWQEHDHFRNRKIKNEANFEFLTNETI